MSGCKKTCPDGTMAVECEAGPGGAGTVAPSDDELSTADDTQSNCIELDTIDGSTVVTGKLGALRDFNDTADWFCFELEHPARLTVGAASPRKYTAGVYSVDDVDRAIGGWTGGESALAISDLNRGAHLVSVRTLDNCCGWDAFEYEITLDVVPYDDLADEPADEPGERATDATVLEVDGAESFVIVGGYVGLGDISDFYRIEVGAGEEATLQLSAVGSQPVKAAAYEYSATPTTPLIPATPTTDTSMATLGPLGEGSYLVEVTPAPQLDWHPPGSVYELTLSIE